MISNHRRGGHYYRFMLVLVLGVLFRMPAIAGDDFNVQDMVSEANGRTYRLLIATPGGQVPADGYPALFVIDGNKTAPLALRWLQQHGLADQVLLVGIGYPQTDGFNMPRRLQDLTPLADADYPDSGQGEAFLTLLNQQALPMIAQRYRLNPHRQALFGHSLGGLTVLAQLLRDPTAFSVYFAASPSLWWADGDFKPQLKQFVDADGCQRAASRHVLVTVGRNEQPPPGKVRQSLDKTQCDKLARRQMVDNAVWAVDTLDQCDDWHVSKQILPERGHHEALADGLRYMLGQWLGTSSEQGSSSATASMFNRE